MTPRRWTVTGLAFLVATVLLAVVSVTEAFDAIRPAATSSPLPSGPRTTTIAASTFLWAVVLGVLAGVAFFTGLACVFWSAAQQRRRRLDEILRRLDSAKDGVRLF